MRIALYAAAALALAALGSPDVCRSSLASAGAALFESTPWLLAAAALDAVLRRRSGFAAYAGCGCGEGPSARSLPAAAAACLAFGPAVACARFAAAVVVARLRPLRAPEEACAHASPLDGLTGLLAAAAASGIVGPLLGSLDAGAWPPAAQLAFGAAAAFAGAPCGLGAVALAGSLQHRAPFAAAAFLCVAGIVDHRALFARPAAHPQAGHDAFAYVLLAAASCAVAVRGGDALVNPAIAPALAVSALASLAAAVRFRRERRPRARTAPALMLAAALIAAPPPTYHATETTLADLFPGERLTFTGTLVRRGTDAALVRYAITCCRADAAPVVIRVRPAPAFRSGTWLRVEGAIRRGARGAFLAPTSVQRIAPPADPFVYR